MKKTINITRIKDGFKISIGIGGKYTNFESKYFSLWQESVYIRKLKYNNTMVDILKNDVLKITRRLY